MKQHLFIYFFIGSLFASNINDVDYLESIQDYDAEFEMINKLYKDNPENASILWRLARAYFNQAEQTTDQDTKNELYYEGYDQSKNALALDSGLARSNHWYAVFHGQIGLIEGTKQKIINSYDILNYGQRAIELDDTYGGTYHLLGRLNYELDNLSWIERNIASLIYETPPVGTFEQAEKYFNHAIRIEPDEIRHWLWLGKTHIKLDNIKQAKFCFTQISSLESKDQKDMLMLSESKDLLEDLE